MIEIKLSQGAKPGHGGVLPKKNFQKIAEARELIMIPIVYLLILIVHFQNPKNC